MDSPGTYDVRILNLDGTLVRNEAAFKDHVNIDVAELAQGFYFIELTNTDTKQQFVQKLTKL